MPNFKVVISDPKTRKSYQKEIDQAGSGLLGKKIRDKVSGNHFGLAGFELEITGGSDKEGFPMRADVHGAVRKKVLLSSGPGFHPQRKGQRKKKSVRGNTISEAVVQVNTKVVTHGQKTIEELWGIKPKEPEKKEEKPKEGKPEKHKEEKKEKTESEEKVEKPKEEKAEKKHEEKPKEHKAEKKETEKIEEKKEGSEAKEKHKKEEKKEMAEEGLEAKAEE